MRVSVDEVLVSGVLTKCAHSQTSVRFVSRYREIADHINCDQGGWEEEFVAMTRRMKRFLGESNESMAARYS